MLWFLAFLHFLYLRLVFSKLVTTTIDDAFPGDTLSSISYSTGQPNDWVQGNASNHGRIMPDSTQCFNSTWHDVTDDTTTNHDGTTPVFMEITFQGTGIDVRCIIANNLDAAPSIPAFTGTKANYSFFIDTVPQNRDFINEAGTTGPAFLYNTSVFSTSDLSNSSHTMKLLLNGGPEVNGSVLVLFDYAIITSDDGTGDAAGTEPTSAATALPTASASANSISSSQAHVSIGAIVGGLVGGVFGLGLLLLYFWLRRKRSRRLRLPKILQLPLPLSYSPPYSRPRDLPPKMGQVDPNQPSSLIPEKPKSNPPVASTSSPPSSSTTNTESDTEPVMMNYVQRLRAEVELLREQQREMVAMQGVPSYEPPPRYEEV
ncbi:hypothetical protein K438DRAFT_1962678 [Mycena galopus ATCC 62051]|nr:hypothetical protein K438DRAFT_1962678 [Mycena galopus ATCC 62051]